MKSPDPNNFLSQQNITINQAIEQQRPIPPWIKAKHKPVTEVKKENTVKKKSKRGWLKVFLIPLLVIHWVAVLVFNLWEIITDALKEITQALENYINAQTEPTFEPPTD